HPVQLWDVVTGKGLASMEGHDYFVTVLAFAPDGRRLLSGSGDATALVWAVPASGPLPRPGKVEPLWADLRAEAAQAHRAIRTLAAAPDEAVRLLGPRLSPVSGANFKEIRPLVADLDADDFL